MKKDRWTESDVVALASEESDTFERKSGLLLEDRGKFLDALAKALSAFANSGGGHLILGVEDDGTLTGLNPREGKEPTRDWLEQKIPALLDYGLSDFRVHTVEPSDRSAIPVGKVVIVIDVGDSALAPHQSKRDKIYYQRVGGRSVPAPHFYLDLLRQRLVSPRLEFRLENISVDGACKFDQGIFVSLKFHFNIRNEGRVAAYKWGLIAKSITCPDEKNVNNNIFFGKVNFPVSINNSHAISIDDTILPDQSRSHITDVGIKIVPSGHSEEEIEEALAYIFQDLRITYQLATEISPGKPKSLKIIDRIDLNQTALNIMELMERATNA